MKIKLSVLSPIIFLFLFLSCKDDKKVKAKIFERKEVQGNKLMIKYNYFVNDQTFTDSATIKNRVIASDSIIVSIDPSNPQKSSPHF